MNRAIILVMDSVGIGGAADAADFGDDGANTLGHIADVCDLSLPNLCALGLGSAAKVATGTLPRGLSEAESACFGAAEEVSPGKDTPTGHWELAGVPLPWEWHYFPDTQPCFPADQISRLIAEGGLPGVLGDKHASGTKVIEELGEEHVRTGKPIVYTSADSVVQIAAHEEVFGLDRLYDLCKIGAEIFHPMRVGRVIARPFVGADASSFERTPNRKDFALEPPEPTLCDRVVATGHHVHAIGKIGDIFAHRGISTVTKGKDDMALFDATLDRMKSTGPGDLLFANFVDFDTKFGHRRDPHGYARALMAFDARLPEIVALLQPGDLLCVTADHGNDPTWKGTEHTRERVAALFSGPGIAARELGLVQFADIGETIAAHLGLSPRHHGRVLF